MRLYLKLFAMVVTAGVIQLTIAGPGEWLDETQFALRVYVAGQLGVPSTSPALVDAADQLRARTLARLRGRLPVPPACPDHVPAPEFAADDACDEPVHPPHLFARAG